MGQYQEVLAWGWLAWSSFSDSGMTPQCCEAIGELGVAQIVCAERCLLILTNSGKVFIVYYSSETQVIQTTLFIILACSLTYFAFLEI